MLQSWWLRVLTLVVLNCALEGCAGKDAVSDVSGSVLLDGQPLADADVLFVPKDDTSLGTHAATTDSEGKFRLIPDRNIPIKPGVYVVTVSKLESTGAGKRRALGKMVNTLPLVYSKRDRTPLKADIQQGDNKLAPFEISSTAKK